MFIFIIVAVAIFFVLGIKDKFADWGQDQTRRDARTGRFVRNLGLLIVGGLILAAMANSGETGGIRFRGNVGYTFNWPMVELRADKVVYTGEEQTKPMRLALYAALQPFEGSTISSWEQIASYSFPVPLRKGQCWEMQHQSVFGNRPSPDKAHIIFTVEEFDADKNQWQLRDYRNFEVTRAF